MPELCANRAQTVRKSEVAIRFHFGTIDSETGCLAAGGRITVDLVDEEVKRLQASWRETAETADEEVLVDVLGENRAAQLDRFDRTQLADVLTVLRESRSLSQAGRILFSESRKQRKRSNDADRLRKYLGRFDIDWREVMGT